MPIEVSKESYDILMGLSDSALLVLALVTAFLGLLAWSKEPNGSEASDFERMTKSQRAALFRARATLTNPLALLVIIAATSIKLAFAVGSFI